MLYVDLGAFATNQGVRIHYQVEGEGHLHQGPAAVILGGPTADLVAYSYREHVFHRHVKGSYTGTGVTDEAYFYTERVGYELPDYLARLQMPRQVHWQGPGFDHPDQDTADTAVTVRFVMDGALEMIEHLDPHVLHIGLVATNIVGYKYGPPYPSNCIYQRPFFFAPMLGKRTRAG